MLNGYEKMRIRQRIAKAERRIKAGYVVKVPKGSTLKPETEQDRAVRLTALLNQEDK
jgi:hypothetical protein